jgi:type IV secretory pathway VirB4 component
MNLNKIMNDLSEKLLLKSKIEKDDMKQTLLPYLLAPSTIINEPDHIRIGEYYNRVIAVVGIPRVIKAGFLNSLIMHQGNFDISFHINPKPVEFVITQLNNELIKISSDMYLMQSKGEIVPPSMKIKYDDMIKVLGFLQTGEEKLFDFSFYINIRSNSIEKLNELTEKIGATLGQLSLLYKVMDMEMHDSIPSIIPLSEDRLKITRNMTSSALAATYPFTSSNLQVAEKGVVVGINNLTNIPLIVDMFSLQNNNMLVLGGSGSGKSFSVKSLLLRLNKNNTRIFVIDPQGEYRKMASMMGDSQVIDFSPSSRNAINPFDLNNVTLNEKIESLQTLFSIIAGDLTPIQKSIIEEVLYEAYEAYENDTKISPTFKDVYYLLEKKSKNKQIQKDALMLKQLVKPYIRDSVQCFSNQTKVKLNSKFIVFDVSYFMNKTSIATSPAMFIILEFLSSKMRESIERKTIVVDEGWRLLKSKNISEYILVFTKTARKYNTSFQIITQELGDLANSDAGNAVLANTSMKLLFRQDPTKIDEISNALKLSNSDSTKLITASVGEGILILENVKIPFKSFCTPEEEKLITTKPE